jgi:hypothetical protein
VINEKNADGKRSTQYSDFISDRVHLAIAATTFHYICHRGYYGSSAKELMGN